MLKVYRQRGHYLSKIDPLDFLQLKKWDWVKDHYQKDVDNLFTAEEREQEVHFEDT